MKMAYRILQPLILLLLFTSCGVNGKKADAYGNFESDEVIVSSEMTGRVTRLSVEVGDVLKERQVVGRIDSTQAFLKYQQLLSSRKALQAKINAAQAQVTVARTQLDILQKEKERIEKLYRDSASTQQQLDEINGKYEIAKAQFQAAKVGVEAVVSELEALESQLRQAADMLSKCTIVNPVNGTVLERYAEAGELVTAGSPLYKIADISYLYLRAYVSGLQLPAIKIGQQVKVMIDKTRNESTVVPGEIIWISSQAEFTPKIIQTKEERVSLVYAIRVKVKNDGTLKIGMPGEVWFHK